VGRRGRGIAAGRLVSRIGSANEFRSRATNAPSCICYVIHGGAYVVFSQMRSFQMALLFLALSRAAIAVSSVFNLSQLLRHVSDEFRGRVFATMETCNGP
jgi:hypothetical protein